MSKRGIALALGGDMVNLKKAAKLIQTEGLFTFIYNEMKELTKKEHLSTEEILELLHKHPHFLDSYKELNTQSEISNIQLRKHTITEEDSSQCQKIKQTINDNIDKLIALEAFEKPADSMIYVVWIGSLTAFLIFIVHNLVVLYTFWYEHYKSLVFASYGILMLGGYLYYKKMMKKHNQKHQEFLQLSNETKNAIQEGIQRGCFSKQEVYA